MLNIVIVGRPNVGKSTLFNRLIKKDLSIVSEEAGTTRDYKEYEAEIADIKFKLTDLAGLDFSKKDKIILLINKFIHKCIDNSNIILMVIDANVGITSDDVKISNLLRKTNKPVILLGNKSEKKNIQFKVSEGWSLGLGPPIVFSALHGIGIDDLYERIKEFENKKTILNLKKLPTNIHNNPSIKIAFVGKPNTGKSTLINKLLGYERMITSKESGTTHDSIELAFKWKNNNFTLIDTAGMRKKSKLKEDLEYRFVGSSLKAIKHTNIAILVVDGTDELNKQDLSIARWIIEEGRALILCINKWDLIINKQEVFNNFYKRLQRSLPDMSKSQIVKSSGLLGLGIDEILNLSVDIYKNWNERLTTSILNNWFSKIIEDHPPPLASSKKRIKLQYISQVKSRPPTFVIFSNYSDDLPNSYITYIKSKLRDHFQLFGVPLRIKIRKKKNPYIN